MSIADDAIALGWSAEETIPPIADVPLVHADARFLVWQRPDTVVAIQWREEGQLVSGQTTRKGTTMTTLRDESPACARAANEWHGRNEA